MNNRFTRFIYRFYDPQRHEFLGRDGLRWAKLGLFYFGFYLGLGAFFCLMIGIFMAVTPRDVPRYYGESSAMNAGSDSFSPGLGFRPHRDPETHFIYIDRTSNAVENNHDLIDLKDYLRKSYPAELTDSNITGFRIADPGNCTEEKNFGFLQGQPCILVKINKIVGFQPIPGYRSEDEVDFRTAGCQLNPQAVAIHCYGEYPADADAIGNITYISENGHDDHCGEIDRKWFPYPYPRFQTPYIWVQFHNPKPNRLIDVVCRLFAQNAPFHKIRSQASTRFQLYIHDSDIRSE